LLTNKWQRASGVRKAMVGGATEQLFSLLVSRRLHGYFFKLTAQLFSTPPASWKRNLKTPKSGID